jgi:hypothetical protein
MEEEIAFALLLRRIIRRRQKIRRYKRRYSVQPLISCRLLKGRFYALFSDLRYNPEKFQIAGLASISIMNLSISKSLILTEKYCTA